MRTVLLVAMMCVATAAAQTPPASGAAAPKGDAANGRKLFASYGCYQCHGYAAQGAPATGPRLAPGPVAFDRFSRSR